MEQTGQVAPIGGTGAAAKPRRSPKADAFKQEMARAMEGAGPPASVAALRSSGRMRPALAAVAPAPRAPDAAFRNRIALTEVSATRPDQGYAARNPSSGALGRYQFVPQALRDFGWQSAKGGWTPLAASQGVRSEADFLASPAAQEAAMTAYLRRAEMQLDRNGSLGRVGDAVLGLDGRAVPLTEAGLVAAAHRRGAGSVARYLAHRTGTPEAALSPAQRSAFDAVERRLRDFAELPYAVAGRLPRSA